MTYEQNQMTAEEAQTRIWEVASSERVCMMTSWNGKEQRARPMTPHIKKDLGLIYFLDKYDSEKEKEISRFPSIALSFSNGASNSYAALGGTATVSNDRALIKELWSAAYKTWWDSENDPTIRVIIFAPETGEVWDGPNTLVAGAIMLANATTGSHLSLGKSAKVAM